MTPEFLPKIKFPKQKLVFPNNNLESLNNSSLEFPNNNNLFSTNSNLDFPNNNLLKIPEFPNFPNNNLLKIQDFPHNKTYKTQDCPNKQHKLPDKAPEDFLNNN